MVVLAGYWSCSDCFLPAEMWACRIHSGWRPVVGIAVSGMDLPEVL